MANKLLKTIKFGYKYLKPNHNQKQVIKILTIILDFK